MTTVKTDDYVRLPNASNTTLTSTRPTSGHYALMMSKHPEVKDVYQTAVERSKITEYETFDAREVLGLHD